MYGRQKLKKILTHPNTLTMFRVAAVPAIVLLMYFPNRFSTFMAALLFSAASITDYLDGYLARRRGLITNFGKVMDPVADKLLVSSSLIMLVYQQWAPAWIICVIIGREIAVTGLRSLVVEFNEDISASWLGKYKVGFQVAACIPLLLHYSYFGINFHGIGTFFLMAALIFTIWSGADYFFKFRKHLTP